MKSWGGRLTPPPPPSSLFVEGVGTKYLRTGRVKQLNSGVEKCTCRQTFNFASERDWEMKLRTHSKFCSKIVSSRQIRTHKKPMTPREKQHYKAESLRFLHENHNCSNIYPSWIDITTFGRNLEATLCLRELTSARLIKRVIQVHMRGNTFPDCQGFQ